MYALQNPLGITGRSAIRHSTERRALRHNRCMQPILSSLNSFMTQLFYYTQRGALGPSPTRHSHSNTSLDPVGVQLGPSYFRGQKERTRPSRLCLFYGQTRPTTKAHGYFGRLNLPFLMLNWYCNNDGSNIMSVCLFGRVNFSGCNECR